MGEVRGALIGTIFGYWFLLHNALPIVLETNSNIKSPKQIFGPKNSGSKKSLVQKIQGKRYGSNQTFVFLSAFIRIQSIEIKDWLTKFGVQKFQVKNSFG